MSDLPAARLPNARWTHIALRVKDIEASLAWYLALTPLELLARRTDEFGYGAWIGMSDSPDRPFVLVLAQFFAETDPYDGATTATMSPFAHLGIELPERADVDAIASRGAALGCLAMPAIDMPPPVGYVCMLVDPDGNNVEFSHDQGVYAAAQRVWGAAAADRRC